MAVGKRLDGYMNVVCEASARINPTEDLKVLERALKQIVYSDVPVQLATENETLRMNFLGLRGLTKLKEQSAARRVRGVLRRLILSEYRSGEVTLMLNRQALTQGIIAFVESEAESPLGPVYLKIACNDVKWLIDFLAPLPPK